jgi:cytochrome d ubiquinol oxidase subunit I
VYAVGMLRGRRDRLHRLGLAIPFTVAAIAAPLQVFVGDVAAPAVFENEPAKFAMIEALPETSTRVPEVLGGVVIDGEVRYGIQVPLVASLLAGLDPDTRIQGLDAIPADERPADRLVNTVHTAFQVMVGLGTALLALAAWGGFSWWRHRRLPENRLFLACTAVSGLAAVVALEAGWVVTEVGRQPWTVYGVLLTSKAATTATGVLGTLTATLIIYSLLTVATFAVLWVMRRRWQAGPGGPPEPTVPYAPADQPPARHPGQPR